MRKRTGKANFWLILLVSLVYVVITAAFAYQTLEFIGWLFPDDEWFMKTITMFSFDGCATGFAIFEMFYRFRLRKTKGYVLNMWYFTFGLSSLASILQMFLASTHLIPHVIPPIVIFVAYALVIVAFVVDIVAIVQLFRMEWNAAHPDPRGTYDDDEGEEEEVQPVAFVQTRKTSVPSEPTTQPMQPFPSVEEMEEYRRWKAQQNGPLS